eukprot:1753250-Amphidinium_carterae.1
MGLGECATYGCQHPFGMKVILSVFWDLPATPPPPPPPSPPLKSDHDMVLAAVQQKDLALQWADEALRSDHGLVLAVVQ